MPRTYMGSCEIAALCAALETSSLTSVYRSQTRDGFARHHQALALQVEALAVQLRLLSKAREVAVADVFATPRPPRQGQNQRRQELSDQVAHRLCHPGCQRASRKTF